MADSLAPPDAEGSASRLAAGIFGGFILLAGVNAVAIAVAVPLPADGLSLRLGHHVFDAAETLGLGAVVAVVVSVFVRLARRSPWTVRGVGLFAGVALVNVVIGEYLGLQAAHLISRRFERPVLLLAFAFLGALFIVAAALAAVTASRPGLRFAPAVFATALLVADQLPLRDDYPGIHGLVAFGATLIAAPSLGPFVLRSARALARSGLGRALLAAVAAVSALGVVVAPANAVRCELFRQPCAIASWVLATAVWSAPRLHSPVAVTSSKWLLDRTNEPPTPPTIASLLPRDVVVVLITIDALRADVVSTPDHDQLLPTFAELRRDGVVFTHASTPGTQTPISLSTMFSGLYFSEQRWANYGTGFDRFPYPANDPSPRFPELLQRSGVATVDESAYVFLANRFGVARGFTEERVFGDRRSAAPARRLVGAMLARLAKVADERLFAYAHLAEPHGPYHLGRKDDDDFDRYLSAVAVADAQLARVLRFLEEHFVERWVLVVSADHGEAFGDHQTFDHSKTLYEELLHVPLIVRSPLFAARQVSDRVGLIDLGPTILDLFGVDTPATFNGQSLVPFLTGGSVSLTRPLLAEGRLRTALTEPDGWKVIEDPRRKVVEAYDLVADPHETRNVFDLDPARVDPSLAFLRAFFAAHTLRAGGYEPPYKP